MANRPFFKASIADLEQKFEQAYGDPQFRTLLREELRHRTTQRAERLQQRLNTVEEAAQQSHNTSTPNASAPAFASAPPHNRFDDLLHQPEPHAAASAELAASAEPSTDDATCAGDTAPIKPMPIDVPPTKSTAHRFSQPEAVLHAWTAMEVLSPATFTRPASLCSGDFRNVVRLSSDVIPWQDGVKRYRKNCRLYYQIILGTIRMEPAMEALLKVYADAREQRPAARGEAILASVMVDNEGRLAGQNPVVISSFGWGVPVALRGDLRSLGQWPLVERQLVEATTARLTIQDDAGEILPLTADDVSQAFLWLTQTLGLDSTLTSQPSFALCTYQWYKNPDAPDPALLNSFFLKDLAWAKTLHAQNKLPDTLQRYLGSIAPEKRWNLMQNQDAVRRVLAPAKFPTASWPGPGRHPLALLQQCAVNIALSDLKKGEVLAVNGPPGTGKTTLLRDVVAAIITERAKVLASYADPEDAFTHSGQKCKRGAAFLHMYAVDKKLRGFEIVVASSNNKAVENVSVELPSRHAIAKDCLRQGYFSTVSDALFSDETWGMISAALGNAANRTHFRNIFWWDNDFGMQKYFQHACGTPAFYTNDNGKQCIPLVIQKEDPPPDHATALLRWKKARQHFLQTLQSVNARLADLQKIHALYERICQHHTQMEEQRTQLPHLKAQFAVLREALASMQSDLADKQSLLDAASAALKSVEKAKPGFFSSLLRTEKYRTWSARHAQVKNEALTAQRAFEQARECYEENILQQEEVENSITKREQLLRSLTHELETMTKQYAQHAAEHTGTCIDAAFFAKSHGERQTTPPWLDAQTAQLRGDLFEAAMALHKAFIDGAAKPIRHNCGVFLESFGTKSLGSPEKDALIADLWSTLFLIVPVISTTFASVSNMFSGLDQEALGWLLIDEAGQALPQAAVGALLRAQRAVVVGDPLQIEPIVVLPESLTEKICENFSVDPHLYNAPGASAQTLADRSTAYMGSFETPYGSREVGVPLLVHRRCAEPMFSISNAIAYENLMVQAKQSKLSPVVSAVGGSRWLHVSGKAQGKWCPQSGEYVLQLVRAIRDKGCAPDIYLVTPFVDVQNGLRSLLLASSVLEGWVENAQDWVNERVGTVHTVQGREAEAVIFVLGAPEGAQRGARAWAGKSPNLLNVAVTRAKEAVYVVGCKDAWKDAGVFQTLHRMIS